jgi:hypothetical protein
MKKKKKFFFSDELFKKNLKKFLFKKNKFNFRQHRKIYSRI